MNTTRCESPWWSVFAEAKIGYVPAAKVIEAAENLWTRDPREFRGLVRWCVGVAEQADAKEIHLRSDRSSGSDSRTYSAYFAENDQRGTARSQSHSWPLEN